MGKCHYNIAKVPRFVSDIDECISAPCMNGATCSDDVNGYSCNCTSGYIGDNCETGQYLFYYLSHKTVCVAYSYSKHCLYSCHVI